MTFQVGDKVIFTEGDLQHTGRKATVTRVYPSGFDGGHETYLDVEWESGDPDRNEGWFAERFELAKSKFAFEVGDKVECIFQGNSGLLKVGEKYTVSKIWIGAAGGQYIRLEEIGLIQKTHSYNVGSFTLVNAVEDTGVESTVLAAIESILMNQISLDTLTHDLLDSVMSALNANHNIK